MGTLKDQTFAVVTGASSGIGFELARQCVKHGFEVMICSDSAEIHSAARQLSREGARVAPVQADLSTPDGVEIFASAVLEDGRPVDALLLNAGVGVGGSFLDTPLEEELAMISLNIMSVVHLTKRLLPPMVKRGRGRILVTASVASTMPTPYATVYGATKAFDLSFAEALRAELAEHGISVTALQPGATDTRFFERAHMTNTPVGQGDKDDPADVARLGFEAMMAGKDSVIASSSRSKMTGLLNEILPETAKAKLAAKQHKPNDLTVTGTGHGHGRS